MLSKENKKFFYIKGVLVGEMHFELDDKYPDFFQAFEIKEPEIIVLEEKAILSYNIVSTIKELINIESYELLKSGFFDAIEKEMEEYTILPGDILLKNNKAFYVIDVENEVKIVELKKIFKEQFDFLYITQEEAKKIKLGDKKQKALKKWIKGNKELLREFKERLFKSVKDMQDFNSFVNEKFMEVTQ